MVEGTDEQKQEAPEHKPTQKELEAEFDKLAQLLFDLYQKAKSLQI